MTTFIKGRTNLACTIFFPVKCGNNCSFCTSKQMYEHYIFEKRFLTKIVDNIKFMNNCDVVNEFVITGGEPLINLKVLKKIVKNMTKPVYINTSLPRVDNIDDCIEFINTTPIIKGVNISRHIGNTYSVETCDKNKIDAIKKPKRINCLIKPEYTFDDDKLLNFINFYADSLTMINFRADYRLVTTDTLKNRDLIDEWLMKHFRYLYNSNCLVCNSEYFSTENNHVICYHRGLEHSKVVTDKYTYVNDILINVYGNVYSDWDMCEDFTNNQDFTSWLKSYYDDNTDDNEEEIFDNSIQESETISDYNQCSLSVTNICGLGISGTKYNSSCGVRSHSYGGGCGSYSYSYGGGCGSHSYGCGHGC